MGKYSKLIGAVVGPVVGFVVAQFALPPEWASPEAITGVTGFVTAVFVWAFPPNAEA